MAAGPGLQFSEMETHARLLAQDGDTTGSGLTSAQYLSLINQRYESYFLQVEPRVLWLTANQCGLKLVASTRVKAVSTTGIDELIAVFDEGTHADGDDQTQGQPLQRASIEELLAESVYLGAETADPSQRAAPSRFAALISSAEPGSGSSRGLLTVYFDRYSTAFERHYSIMVRVSPTLLVNSDDTPDVTVEGSYIIATLAAYDAARLMGGYSRGPEFVDGILKFVPDDVQERLMVARAEREPAVVGGKARV